MLEGLSSDILERPLPLVSNDMDGEALAHFGIKGQKWGVRRYQNPDGSLTEEGKKRYNSNGDYNSYRGGTGKITKDFPNDPAKQASVLKQIADSRKKDAYDRLEKASKSGDLNKDISELIKSGTVKNKADALQYTVDAAKKYNEEIDDDGSMFQSLGHELYLYQKGYLDKGTFDKLYDAEAARSVADYGRNMYTDPIYAESVKDMHNYKSKLNNRLSWWFGDNSSNPEYNPNKPISYTEGSAEKEDYYASHSDDYSDFLAHHGIKGQKWGNRRYQNSDGSLTPLGRVRYGVGAARKATGKAAIAGGKMAGKALRRATGMQTDAELAEELAKAQKKHDRDMTKRAIAELYGKKTPLSRMTDAEVDQYLNRLNKTKQINNLEKEIKDQGRGFVSKLAHNTMNNAADNLASGVGEGIKRGVSQKISDAMNSKSEDKLKKAADDARNKKSAYQDELELRALQGDKEATKNLRKVANAKKGKKGGGGSSSDGSTQDNSNKGNNNKKASKQNTDKYLDQFKKASLSQIIQDPADIDKHANRLLNERQKKIDDLNKKKQKEYNDKKKKWIDEHALFDISVLSLDGDYED